MAATTGAAYSRRSINWLPETNPLRNAVSWAGVGVGVAGLAIDAWMIFPSMMSVSATNPVARSLPDVFIYFWTYFTHLTNLWLVLTHLSVLTGAAWLGWFRRPTTMASAATFITLVMLYYHFMLAPYLHMQGALQVATYLLHYVAPIIYLAWWVLWAPHGRLGFGRIPMILLPGVIYIAWVLLRGAIVSEYPYAILDVSKAGYGGVAIGVLALLLAVTVFALIFVAADGWLGRRQARAA
jgi:hypothetical protein